MMINGYYPRIGGAERQLGFLAPRLQSKGMPVYILTRRYPGLSPFEEVEGVPVHRLPVPGPKPVASLAYTLTALKLLKRIKPDILHAHELFSTTTTAVIAKAILNRPVVVTAHSSGYFGDVRRLRKKLLGKQRLETFCHNVDYFVAISNLIEHELQDAGVNPNKLIHIPNAVDIKRFQPLKEEKHDLREHLGVPPDSLVVIYTGRLSREKRPENLFKVWPKIQQDFPNSNLLILGTGPQEQELKAQLSPGIKMLGDVGDVVPYLQASDLFVLPSSAEGLPVSLLEAMACGLPAVATAVGGTPEVLENNLSGYLIPSDDLPALQVAICTMLANPQLRLNMGAAGRKRVVTQYSLEMSVSKLMGLYEQIAEERGKKP